MMAAAAVTFAVKDAMMHAGFSTDKIVDRIMQQRVWRMADKKRKKAPPSNVFFVPSPDSSSISTFSQSQTVSSNTRAIGQEYLPSTSISASSIRECQENAEQKGFGYVDTVFTLL
jgi:hypothetical protein